MWKGLKKYNICRKDYKDKLYKVEEIDEKFEKKMLIINKLFNKLFKFIEILKFVFIFYIKFWFECLIIGYCLFYNIIWSVNILNILS